MSNSYDQDQTRRSVLSGLVWAKTVCIGYLQTTQVGEEMEEIGQIGEIEIIIELKQILPPRSVCTYAQISTHVDT